MLTTCMQTYIFPPYFTFSSKILTRSYNKLKNESHSTKKENCNERATLGGAINS